MTDLWKIVVLLTGMGADSGRGLLALRRLGYHTSAQDQSGCTVYGMQADAAQCRRYYHQIRSASDEHSLPLVPVFNLKEARHERGRSNFSE